MNMSEDSDLEYAPIPVKDLLRQMRDASWLMVNLAFSAVIYGDVDLAEETLRLENEMDRLELLLIMQAALATRNIEDAERIVSIYRLATATARIGGAAGDIAKMALSKVMIPRDVAFKLFEESGMLVQVPVGEELASETLSSLQSALDVSFDVVAVRRRGETILEPPLSFTLEKGDRLFIRGTGEALREVLEHLGHRLPEPAEGSRLIYRFVADMVSKIRDASMVMVDLAYTAVMTKSEELASKVSELEEYVDMMVEKFIGRIVASRELEPTEQYGLIRVITASEEMADAALTMVQPLLLGLEPHPLIAEVLQETMERISVIELDETDEGKTLAELGYGRRGISILAIRRGEEWIVKPRPGLRVRNGDILIVKYTSEADKYVEELEREEDREEIIEEIQEEEWEN